MGLLSFEKPKRKVPVEEWKKLSFDDGPDGGYMPNMSDEDLKKFRAKHIKGDDERIEIRVCIGANIVIIVYKNKKRIKNEQYNIRFSTNGRLELTFEEWNNLYKAVDEAKHILDKLWKVY